MTSIYKLAPNPLPCFFRGGGRLAAFRKIQPVDGHPEEWLGSTTARWGGSRESLTVLSNGRVLAEEIRVRPEYWLGPDHLRQHGPDPALLVKLLDVGQRLPVHAHPSVEFARRHLHFSHGKNEAWIVLSVESGAGIYLGLREAVSRQDLQDAIEVGDTDLTPQLNRLEPRPGDSFFVPAGTLHSIDPGIFILELQEPADLSLLLDWRNTGLSRSEAALGLRPDLAAEALSIDALPPNQIDALHRPDESRRETVADLLPKTAQSYFRAQHVAPNPDVSLAAGFAIGVVLEGRGAVRACASSLEAAAGDALLLPWAAGEVTAEGEMRMVWCRPAAT